MKSFGIMDRVDYRLFDFQNCFTMDHTHLEHISQDVVQAGKTHSFKKRL